MRENRKSRSMGASPDTEAVGLSHGELSSGQTTEQQLERNIFSRAFVMLDVQEGDRILDFGCGAGRSAFWLYSVGARPVGVDLSPRAIERARGGFPEIQFEAMPGGKAPFEDAHFHKVFSSFTHVTWATEEIMLQAHREIIRLLAPGGVYVTLASASGRVMQELPETTPWTEKEIAGNLAKAGFSVEEVHRLDRDGSPIRPDDETAEHCYYLIKAIKGN